ncbi:choice-of-anchor Q domain-containing protein [Chroococcus sp. FPU101]|uniref:choice-of-anchor Q domain-containing protein n=1 Tax=Chroococcus sp. FPU101 TaxID=1974212 RepID=UPI001A903396|nr:choice-of-anchor Q domain-containing protein [Chroococcus sp. FPU101]GFE71829.1 hypothetical protein CFPU101_44390 [Chroococcus sp. FPU101]
MATYTVTNFEDSGEGSLREAIEQANITPGADLINFSGVTQPIILTSGDALQITGSLTILGTGITVSGNNSTRVFNIDDGTEEEQNVEIVGLTITNGFEPIGGGIFNLENTTITNSIITQNGGHLNEDSGGAGGGIHNQGTLHLVNSTVSGNSALKGGGILNYLGEITIINSTISGNTATNQGGGIYNGGYEPCELTIINSTISGNTATNQGGGIYNGGYQITANLVNVTIAENTAASGGGIFHYNKDVSTLAITNTIIARNSEDLVSFNNSAITQNNNIIGDSEALKLGLLNNNGGPTLTYALMSGSIAINAGNNEIANANGITTDQRGQNRFIDGIVDIGAYEFSETTFPEFDPAQYGASNPDLIPYYINAGHDLAFLTNHYLTSGRFEGRSTDTFNEFRYVASSYVTGGDLIGAFHLDGGAATLHYINSGFVEGRSKTAFDPARYINSYDDLLNYPSIGQDTLAATQHFITDGFAPDGRNPNLFPSDRYLASYRDLINAFAPITDYAAKIETASNHYLNSGRGEMRSITFDPTVYLNRYSDVAADPFFGASLERATQHYLVHGFFEGRLPY